MLRTTTLLIVTILAAGPVGSFGCELWCSSPAVVDHHGAVGCHDASRTSPLGPKLTSTIGCHDAAATTPFLTEARETETRPAVSASVTPLNFSSIEQGSDETAAGWCMFNVQPVRPTSSRSVLRV